MYTECPKCQSVFMVSEQDIAAHEGLVRCGNCYSVFNAGANLTEDPQNSEDADLTSASSDVSATTVELPPGASAVSTSSDFTFNFVEEPAEEAAEDAGQDEAVDNEDNNLITDAPLENDEMDSFPEPDFAGEALDKPVAEVAPTEEDNSLLYFGPDQEDDQPAETESSSQEIPSLDNSLLQGTVFNPAIRATNEADEHAIDEPADNIDTHDDASSDGDEAEETDDAAAAETTEEEPFAGPGFSEDDEETGSEFAMPDFSPLEGLDPDSAGLDTASALSSTDASQDDEPAVEHVETKLDAETLWPSEDEDEDEDEERDQDDSGSLPNPEVNPRYLPDETDDALQAYDDGTADMSLEAPGMPDDEDMPSLEVDEPGTLPDEINPLADTVLETADLAADDVTETEPVPVTDEPESIPELDDLGHTDPDESENVFITSDEDESDEAYQAMNVENDKAFHESGEGDFPLPDEIEDFDSLDNPDIEKLLQQAADGQAEIDAKLAEADISEPEIGTPDIDDDLEDDPVLMQTAPVTEDQDRPGLMNKVSAGIGSMADKLRIGRHSYHGLDTYETQEHQDTLLVRQLEHESHGSLFGFMSPKTQRVLLVMTNLALIVLLVFLTGKYFMDELAQIRVLRPALEAGCQLAGCRVPKASNPSAIEQLSSKMTVLDGQKEGLRIAVTLINRDNVEQPFPSMELSLTDRGGRIISRQVVKAEQYLGKSADSRLMQPGQAEDIKILLRTPAVRVDGFELRPVKLHWLNQQ